MREIETERERYRDIKAVAPHKKAVSEHNNFGYTHLFSLFCYDGHRNNANKIVYVVCMLWIVCKTNLMNGDFSILFFHKCTKKIFFFEWDKKSNNKIHTKNDQCLTIL